MTPSKRSSPRPPPSPPPKPRPTGHRRSVAPRAAAVGAAWPIWPRHVAWARRRLGGASRSWRRASTREARRPCAAAACPSAQRQ
eukprot:6979099-Prymnesium_polylepis.1